MKTICTVLLGLFSMASVAQDIALVTPDTGKGLNVMHALVERRSTREFDKRELTRQDLSNILWATMGVNRQDNRLTAPSCQNKQEIRLFAFTGKGAYEYMPVNHLLRQVAEGDFRPVIAGRQTFAQEAPLCLVMVADMEKFGSTDAGAMTMAAIDAGIVTENACVAAAGLGLAIVPRASMDAGQIRTILGLSDKQIPLMNTPIGYFKGKALTSGFSHDVDSIKVEVSTKAGSHHVLLTSENEAVVTLKDNSLHRLPAQDTERLKTLAEKLFVSKSEPIVLSEEKASGRTDHPIFTVTIYSGGKEEKRQYEMGTEDNGITRCTAKNIRYSDSFRELMFSVLSYAGLISARCY